LKHIKQLHNDLFKELLENQSSLHQQKAQTHNYPQVHAQNKILLHNPDMDDEDMDKELTADELLDLAIANISEEVECRETPKTFSVVQKFFLFCRVMIRMNKMALQLLIMQPHDQYLLMVILLVEFKLVSFTELKIE
jgi:hypothetical protein